MMGGTVREMGNTERNHKLVANSHNRWGGLSLHVQVFLSFVRIVSCIDLASETLYRDQS
jgi:hypothetical protein